MAPESAGYVKQQSDAVTLDGNTATLAMLRERALSVADIVHQWTRAGRVFTTHNPTIGTALTFSAAAAGGHVLTAPSIRLTVPAALTVVPLNLKVTFSAMAGTPNEMALVATDTDTYSSGGTSVTLAAYNRFLDNLGTGQPLTSQVTNLRSGSGSALVEGALTNPRVLDIQYFARADAVSEPKAEWRWNALRDGGLTYIHGPASVLIYISAVTTASAGEFMFDWAELDKNILVNS